MPGMNSGLNPSDPTLVAAFRSALFHQGAVAALRGAVASARAGATLTVWRLARGAWAKVQQITVPIQYGSSG